MTNGLRANQLLALTRISTYAVLLVAYLYFFSGSMTIWAKAMPAEAWTPAGIMQWLPTNLATSSEAFVRYCLILEGLFWISALAAISGFAWKWSSWTTLILSLLVFGIRHSFGHAFRTESILILVQFCFVFSKAADVFSLDAYFSQRMPGKKLEQEPEEFEYVWPLRIMQVMWVSMFFLSGITKLRVSGFAWIGQNYLHDFLLSNRITRGPNLDDQAFRWSADYLIEQPGISFWLGALVIVFELSYPIIFWFQTKYPKGVIVMLTATLFFQVSVYAVMGVNFMFYWALLPIWFFVGSRGSKKAIDVV
jgi:hypothetical protein